MFPFRSSVLLLRSPEEGCAAVGGEEISARNNRKKCRAGLNSRKYFQITKSVTGQQGYGGGPAHELSATSPRAGAGLQISPLSCHLMKKKSPRKVSFTQGESKNVSTALSHVKRTCSRVLCQPHVGVQGVSVFIVSFHSKFSVYQFLTGSWI